MLAPGEKFTDISGRLRFATIRSRVASKHGA
jgi:hypothetical protein